MIQKPPKGSQHLPAPPKDREHPALPHAHLHQNVLALPREQVFEPIKGEVVRHANGRAGGVAHVVRAVPLPVPTDTRKSNGQDDQLDAVV